MKLTTRFARSYALLSARLRTSPGRLTAYWLAALSIFIALLYVRHASSRDPGSWFFNERTAYDPKYSTSRQRQAEHFISSASTAPPFRSSHDPARLCVGIPSIARDGTHYLRTTVGSLLAGLTQQERDGVHLIVFIAHTDPAVHPAYHEAWLPNLADQVLTYNLSQTELDYVTSLERDDGMHREKGLFDYTYLLKACHATEAPYIALIEDDVVAMDGWYHRAVAGIRQAEVRSALEKASEGFLYLRLFYTEQYLGWNSEDWPSYVFWSLTVVLGSALLVCCVRVLLPATQRFLTPQLSVGIPLILIPLSILLVFAVGKVTTFPLPVGVNEMNNFGCCAQGLIFPRHKTLPLVEWFEASRTGFADTLIEQYADEHGEQRWALTPSVLQHVGAASSKAVASMYGGKYTKYGALVIWNFAFESNEVEDLRKEHEAAARDTAV